MWRPAKQQEQKKTNRKKYLLFEAMGNLDWVHPPVTKRAISFYLM